jgi:hypothetical protein
LNILDDGFMAGYINFYSNRILDDFKKAHQQPSSYTLVLDMTNLFKEPSIHQWIVQNRLADIVTNLSTVFTYLKHPMTPELVRLFITQSYHMCFDLNDKNVLIYPPPIDFVSELDSELLGYDTVYTLWCFCSRLIYLLHQQKKDNTEYSEIIRAFTKNTPTSFSKLHIYTCILSMIHTLHSLNMKIYNRFTLKQDELNVIINLLRLEDIPSKTFRKLDSELYKQIYTDIKHIFPTYNINIVKEYSINVYILIESLHSMIGHLSEKTKSRIYCNSI